VALPSDARLSRRPGEIVIAGHVHSLPWTPIHAVEAGHQREVLADLGKPEHVADVVRMSLPEHDGQRMVDLVVAGREQDVLAELGSAAIDARRLLAEGEVDPDEW
jgi:hypothetical protein